MPPSLEGTPSPLPLWRRVLPLFVGAALVLWVATRIDFAAFVRALRGTDAVGFVAFAAVFLAAVLSADVFATMVAYRLTIAPVRYRDIFVIRAASYLPSMVNHHAGQAWLTYFLSRTYRVPLARAAGATLLVYATTFGALCSLLVAGLPLNHGRAPWLLPTVLGVALAGISYAIVLVAKPPALARIPVIAPLLDAGLGGHLTGLIARLPHLGVQFLGAWIPFMFFGVHVPLADALALLPVLMFVSSLPVSPQGIGTRDAASLALLSGFAEGTPAERASAIAATTLSWLVVTTLLQLGFAPLFMRRALVLLERHEVET